MNRCQVKRCLNGLSNMIYSAGENDNQWEICQECWKKHCEEQINLKDDSLFDKDR